MLFISDSNINDLNLHMSTNQITNGCFFASATGITIQSQTELGSNSNEEVTPHYTEP